MKKNGVYILCLFVLILFSGNALAEKKVLIVTSASQEGAKNVGTYYKFFEGIEEVLKNEKIAPEYLFIDFDKAADDAARMVMAKEAIEKIKQRKPDVLVPMGDNAVKFVATQIDSIPSIFGFVYGDLPSMGLPKPNITGVARRSYAVDMWGLMNKLTGAKTVVMLSKDNLSMAGIKNVLMSRVESMEKGSGVKLLDMHLLNTFEEWQGKVKTVTADLIYLADSSRILKEGKEMTPQEVVQWTIENSKIPVIAATDRDVLAGALLTILTSEKAWGNQTGVMVLKLLSGVPIAQMPVEFVSKGALHINAKTAQKYKLEIPYNILSTAEKVHE